MRSIFLIILSAFFLRAFGAEKTAMWVVRDALKSESSINKVVSTAVSNNISDLFVQVRALGQCYYPGKIDPMAEGISPNYDPLALITNKAARYNIRIHAWINTQYVWSGELDTLPDRHILKSAKKGILRTAQDNYTPPLYKTIRRKGIEGYYIDPANQENQERLLAIISEITNNYKVDGIHLDYFRYPSYEYSFSPSGRTNFRLKYQADPLDIIGNDKRPVTQAGIDQYSSVARTYRENLRENLTALLKSIRREIKKNHSDIELSVAVKPDAEIAKNYYFQDWLNWVKNGDVDFVALMNYRIDWNEFLDHLTGENLKSSREKILVGISTYNQKPQAVKRRMNYVRNNEWAGYVLFSYNHLNTNREFLRRLRMYQNFGGNDEFGSTRPAGD